MNLGRMRRRLEAGDYDIGLRDFIIAPLGEGEGRDTNTAVMEDVDWVLSNCIKFNGVRTVVGYIARGTCSS